MTNTKLILFSLVFSIIFSITVSAFPCAFYGTVKLDNNAVNGTLITAYLNDTGEYLATGEEILGLGYYTIVVDAENKLIRFKIAGIWVNESEQNCTSHPAHYLALTANKLPDGSSCEQDVSCSSGYCVECNGQKICRPSKPFSGDGCCQTDENCDNSVDCACPSGQICDTGTCTTPLGPLIPPTLCEENWTCTEWSSCVNETQTRNCTDLNNCNTNNNKPITSQTCFIPPPCVENWSCTDWSKCANKVQNRTCTDSNKCGTQTTKPDETQKCKEEKPKQQAPTTPTGLFLGLNTFDLLTISILGLVLLVVLLFILKRRKPKRKSKRKR
jgi:hypothetical protein